MKNLLLIAVLFLSFGFIQADKNIKIDNVWIRTASTGMNTGLFVTIKNTGDIDEELLGAACNFAEVVEVHETFKKADDMMGMREVNSLKIKAKSTLELKPRSYHIMLIKLTEDLKTGDKKDITFKFKNAGEIKVKAEVKEMLKK
ncbi:MAG: copper chaperone PCu(A)C [bacterium]